MIILTAVTLGLNTEALIILSNFFLVVATMLLTFATSRADRHMMGDVHKDDKRMMNRMLKLIGRGSSNSDSE